MALVKCTKKLKEHVETKINALFQERINVAVQPQEITAQEIAEQVYSSIHTPERLVAMEDLQSIYDNARFMQTSNDFRFSIKYECDGVWQERNISGKFNPAKKMINEFGNSWSSGPTLNNLPITITQPLIDAQKRVNVVMNDRQAFHEAFQKAWSSVKSVNELVKLWPAVVELLEGTDVITRINKKQDRAPKSETPAFDPADLSVQLLKAKIAK